MLRNWFTIAFRNLTKNKLHSAINIVGLAVGLASCIAIILFVRDELSYDRWIPKSESIYRLHVRYDLAGRAPLLTTSSAGPAMAALLRDYPQDLETGVRLLRLQPALQHGSDAFIEGGVLVDPTFFDVFDFPVVAGDRTSALKDPSSIVLTQTLAKKYFGDRNPIGETLTVKSQFTNREVRVTAVMKDLPSNTHMRPAKDGFDFLLPIVESDYSGIYSFLVDSWGSQSFWTYVKLRPGASIAPIADTLDAFRKRHVEEDNQPGMTISLMAVPDIRLNAVAGYSATTNSRKAAVAAFSAIAALILTIASINFMNLATARATQRAREVALRKVLGANRRHLIVQFIGESVLVTGIALLLALALVELTLPVMNAFLGKTLTLSYFGADSLLPALLALTVAVGVVGGTYPAFYLSRFEPARILRPAAVTKLSTRASVREVLVVVQFAISIALIICTAVVQRQTNHMMTMDVGFQQNGLIVLRGIERAEVTSVSEALKQEILKTPGMTSVALSGPVPTDGSNSETTVHRQGQTDAEDVATNMRNVDFGFVGTYQAPLLAGRELQQDYAGDDLTGAFTEGGTTHEGNVILNHRALGHFGYASAQEALGQQLSADLGPDGKVKTTLTVVGVIGDMQFRSARDELPPTIFYRLGFRFNNLTVRYSGMTQADARTALEQVWRRVVPSVPFRGEFLADLVDAQYEAERAQGTMFTAFAALAVIVACLGLYGLASFTAERRTKEIGMRKVLGARVRDIIRILLWQFSKPVTIANLLAWPIAYLIMRDWLDGFEFRIGLSPVFFIGAGLAALTIAWLTVAGHATRVARSSPIHALRYE